MNIINKYFPNLNSTQKEQLDSLNGLYVDWNKMINVISRRDIDHLYEHHVLHSLAIAKFINFNNDAEIMDVGTGGGFPGIPLAILFPYTQFTLVDSVGKKIKVVQAIVDSLQLQNVKAVNCRAEKAEGVDEQFDFIISRATSSLSEIVKWTKGKLKKKNSVEGKRRKGNRRKDSSREINVRTAQSYQPGTRALLRPLNPKSSAVWIQGFFLFACL